MGYTEIIDEDGNSTGEFTNSYSEPIQIQANVSPAMGENSTRQFGDKIDYDRVLVIEDKCLNINEQSIFWIENKLTDTPHDYEVKKIGRSLNSLSISVKKVDVSA